ncbi:hypothetical protein KFZ58_05025 [Virgibacillus sp. NKC19-16]|uniref:hypothetical protein n=1 Tax=Virgibacillus salidurans TaxID=2831673 RepID=UPI001F16E6EA|nr:hypothetical protein [Virgibacillus sp. NKC19-16]UJL47276.1 hypothetical protein KFZ58_05025 [Virgibacillus sp. NKC19-16]
MSEAQMYQRIYELREQLSDAYSNYWNLYSDMSTWFFWFNLASVVIPFIILYFAIDRERLFEISFYGYTVHVLWSNVDNFLTAQNYLSHPHTLTGFIPAGVTVTAVVLPVTFMLLYQYCTNKGKNFYLYAIVASFIFGCGFGGISMIVDLLRMHNGMNLFYLFLIDIVVAFLALWMTRLFFKIKKTKRKI